MKIRDSRWRVGRTWGRLVTENRGTEWQSLEGTVATEHGIVSAWAHDGRAVLRIIVDGYEYSRTLERKQRFTAKGLAILAGRFAADMAS